MIRDLSIYKSSALLVPTLGVAIALCSVGCAKHVDGNKGEPVRDGDAAIAVTVTDASVKKVTLDTDTGPLLFETPVLAVSLKFENLGEADHFYQPRHADDKAVNIQEPLLFVRSGEDAKLTTNITSVRLGGGLMPEQQGAGVKIKPGSSLSDVYLFTVPAEEKLSLVLTVPPSMHGGEKMLHINIPYTKNELPEEPVGAIKDEIELDGIKITVSGAETTWVPLKHERDGKGFSSDPVFKVSYTVENAGEGDLRCSPNHANSGTAVLSPSLKEVGGQSTYRRIRFGSSTEVPGQIEGDVTVGAAKSQEDFALFERPPKGVDKVMFIFPGALCGVSGIARVEIPYKYESPERPKEISN